MIGFNGDDKEPTTLQQLREAIAAKNLREANVLVDVAEADLMQVRFDRDDAIRKLNERQTKEPNQ